MKIFERDSQSFFVGEKAINEARLSMFFKDLKVERVEGELATSLLKWYPLHKHGFVKIGQKKWFLPYKYVENGDNIYNFEIRPDDTWIFSYPRSGKLFSLCVFRFII